MNKTEILKAFESLDEKMSGPTRIIVGGGAALMISYGIPISTADVDGVPDKGSPDMAEFKKEVREVGEKLGIPKDWLNDYFSTFLFVLPRDYGGRLVTIFKGDRLEACALGKEDLILMKCFAGRDKDIPHIRALLKKKPDIRMIRSRLDELLEKRIPGAQKASDLFDDICAEMGIG